MMEQVLDDVLESSQVMKSEAAFVASHNRVEPVRETDFPTRVEYPRQCTGLCERTTPKGTLALQKAVLAKLASHCRLTTVCSDVVIVCEMDTGDGDFVVTGFGLLCYAHGRHGRFRAGQGVLCMEVIRFGGDTDHAFSDAILRGVCKDHIQMSDDLPKVFQYFSQNSAGCENIACP